jgi:hypothetical protein
VAGGVGRLRAVRPRAALPRRNWHFHAVATAGRCTFPRGPWLSTKISTVLLPPSCRGACPSERTSRERVAVTDGSREGLGSRPICLSRMRVHDSAGRHGVDPEDAIHAAKHVVFVSEPDDESPARQIRLGLDTTGRLLEWCASVRQRQPTRHPRDESSTALPRTSTEHVLDHAGSPAALDWSWGQQLSGS